MITYLINSALCSLIFYLAYILLLENENIHGFKRVYLLFSLVFSLIIPLIQLNVVAPPAVETIKQAPVILSGLEEIHQTVNESVEQTTTALSNNLSDNTHIKFLQIAGVIYWLVTVVLLLRFLRNILSITRQKQQGIALQYHDATISLIKEKIIPHSFGKYIFINKEDYETGQITEEIIIHESSHVKQRHFLDIIFMELLLIFFWFNLVLYLYRNKIKLNHEFLADNAVIQKNNDIPYYQTLLIRMVDQQKSAILTSSFNFSLIKKRLIMMTKTTSKRKVWCRKLALIPIFLVVIGFFSAKITANQLPEQVSGINETVMKDDTVIYPLKGVSLEELNEYKEIIIKNFPYDNRRTALTQEEVNRLYILYTQMDWKQRSLQAVSFSSVIVLPLQHLPLAKKYYQDMTKEEWDNYVNELIKGNTKLLDRDSIEPTILLDGEKIEPSKLNTIDRESIVLVCGYNNTATFWTQKGFDEYREKYERQITQSELLKLGYTSAYLTKRLSSKEEIERAFNKSVEHLPAE